MTCVKEEAYAKINLTLDVLGLREDGYHDMDMVMQSVSLSDTVTLTLEERPGVRVKSLGADLPQDRSNLAVDAAYRYLEAVGCPKQGLSMTIEKRIPVCAGTAGGSSDAAAVLRGLNRLLGEKLSQEALMQLGSQVGSDVPYCVLGGTARAKGRGEVLSSLPSLPPCWIVLCKPDFPISTPQLFRRIDQYPEGKKPNTKAMLRALEHGQLPAVAKELYNVFEAVLPEPQRQEVQNIRRILSESGALGTCMSGTGPTVFGLFDRKDRAEQAADKLQEAYPEVFFTKAV